MTTIITKNSSTASAVPLVADLTKGELAVNVTDKRIFTKDNSATVVELGTNPTSVTTGNVTISGTGKRITGDFSNATVANRVMFQTSTANGATQVSAIPNGTSAVATFAARNSSDPTNSGVFSVGVSSAEASLNSTINGTGTYLPMTFYTGGSESFRCATDGTLTVSKAAGLGYGTGSGGTVTQATSKSTSVTLNKPTGQITMNNAALAAGASIGFAVNNTFAAGQTVLVAGDYGAVNPGNYRIEVSWVGGSGFAIRVTNISGGSLSEALVINFSVISKATS